MLAIGLGMFIWASNDRATFNLDGDAVGEKFCDIQNDELLSSQSSVGGCSGSSKSCKWTWATVYNPFLGCVPEAAVINFGVSLFWLLPIRLLANQRASTHRDEFRDERCALLQILSSVLVLVPMGEFFSIQSSPTLRQFMSSVCHAYLQMACHLALGFLSSRFPSKKLWDDTEFRAQLFAVFGLLQYLIGTQNTRRKCGAIVWTAVVLEQLFAVSMIASRGKIRIPNWHSIWTALKCIVKSTVSVGQLYEPETRCSLRQ